MSRHRRRSSDRSAVVRPSAQRPSSRSACLTQLGIDCAEGSNSRARWSGLRPDRTRSTICCRYSAGYRGLDLGIVDTSSSKEVLSTKPGQAHSAVNDSVVAFSCQQGKPQKPPRLCLCSPAVPWNRATTIQHYPYLFGSTQPTSQSIAGPARRIEGRRCQGRRSQSSVGQCRSRRVAIQAEAPRLRTVHQNPDRFRLSSRASERWQLVADPTASRPILPARARLPN